MYLVFFFFFLFFLSPISPPSFSFFKENQMPNQLKQTTAGFSPFFLKQVCHAFYLWGTYMFCISLGYRLIFLSARSTVVLWTVDSISRSKWSVGCWLYRKNVATPVLWTLLLTTKHKYYFDVMILFKKQPQTTKQTKPQTIQTSPKQSPKQTKPIFAHKSSVVIRCSTGEHQELASIPGCLLAFEKANHSGTVIMCLFPFSKVNEVVWLSLLDIGKGHNCSDRDGF